MKVFSVLSILFVAQARRARPTTTTISPLTQLRRVVDKVRTDDSRALEQDEAIVNESLNDEDDQQLPAVVLDSENTLRHVQVRGYNDGKPVLKRGAVISPPGDGALANLEAPVDLDVNENDEAPEPPHVYVDGGAGLSQGTVIASASAGLAFLGGLSCCLVRGRRRLGHNDSFLPLAQPRDGGAAAGSRARGLNRFGAKRA